MKTRPNGAILMAIGGFATAATAQPALVDFEDGMTHGWSINGWDTVSNDDGGNPGSRLHWDNFSDAFFLELRNSTNTDFIGDYTAKAGGADVTLSLDVNTEFIRDFIGNEIPRTLVLELRDYDNPSGGTPWNSVWTEFQLLENGQGWKSYSVTVPDVNAKELPAGWGDFGAEDPNTFEPILPADRTYSDILDGVDEVVFTTAVPGFFYGNSFFNLSVDNIGITPAPGVPMIGALGALAMVRRRR